MKKKVLVATGSLALVGTLAVGGTLAYLSSITETKKNVFSGSKGIHGELVEENWDENNAKNYYPGKVIAKDPKIVNDSNSVAAYVAVTVNFVDTTDGEKNLSYDEFTKYASIEFNTDSWTKVDTDFADKTSVYVYNDIVAPGEGTATIFDNVTVNTGIETVIVNKSNDKKVYKEVEEGTEGAVEKNGKFYVLVSEELITVEENEKYVVINGEKVENAETILPNFRIDVQGYMVQSEFDDKAEGESNAEKAQTELLKMISQKHE